jgi:hypothetical protein
VGGKEQLLRRLCREAVSEDVGWWMPHLYQNFLLGNLDFVRTRGAAQLMSSAVVCVISHLRGGVRVGVLIRWLIRLVLFRALLRLWRIIRRR